MHDGLWRLRTARVTPTKPGAFVAVWERGDDGITRPFPQDESVRGLMVFIEDGERFGVFRFSSEDLDRLGVTSSEGQPGKRGFRLYPEWCSGLNPAALRTQRAQSSCFKTLMQPMLATGFVPVPN